MPLHGFKCENGHRVEEIFSLREDVPLAVKCPECGTKAERRFQVPRPIGVNTPDLESVNARLFSKKERLDGREIRTEKQLRAREAELGIRVMSASEQHESQQWQQQDIQDIGRAGREGGYEGALSHVDDTEIMGVTGWGTSRLRKWQEATENAVAHTPNGTPSHG